MSSFFSIFNSGKDFTIMSERWEISKGLDFCYQNTAKGEIVNSWWQRTVSIGIWAQKCRAEAAAGFFEGRDSLCIGPPSFVQSVY